MFWAEKNVGAEKVLDYGDYFAWGETEPYYYSLDPLTWKDDKSSGYAWASYQFSSDGETFSKYTGSDYSVLLPEDDATYTNDPEKASSMPTTEEWQALANPSNFTWVWTDGYDGTSVNGYIVYAGTGDHTLFDTHIFLPAAGYRSGSGLSVAGSYGYYWSASLDTGRPRRAHDLCFRDGLVNARYDGRYYGQSVRAVRRK